MIIIAGIEQAFLLANQIPEFTGDFDYQEMVDKIAGRKCLSLIYVIDDTPVAFKLGYEINPSEFYSWLGGVVPGHRGYGIAKKLLLKQESWAREQGYSAIRVKSMNDFPEMLCMLISNGYLINDVSNKDSPKDLKIHFYKNL